MCACASVCRRRGGAAAAAATSSHGGLDDGVGGFGERDGPAGVQGVQELAVLQAVFFGSRARPARHRGRHCLDALENTSPNEHR